MEYREGETERMKRGERKEERRGEMRREEEMDIPGLSHPASLPCDLQYSPFSWMPRPLLGSICPLWMLTDDPAPSKIRKRG